MFTNFSLYSRQSKFIAPFGSLASAGIAAGDFSGGVNSGIGVRAGQLNEGESGASFQLPDGSWVSYINTDPDSATIPPEDHDNPLPPDPKRGDPNWVDPNPYNPPPKPSPPRDNRTEDQKREDRIRERQEKAANDARRRREDAAQKREDQKQAAKERGKSSGGGGGGGGGSGGGGSGGGGSGGNTGGNKTPPNSPVPLTAPPTWKGTQEQYTNMLKSLGITTDGYVKNGTGTPVDFGGKGGGAGGGAGAGKPANFSGSFSTAGNKELPMLPAQQASLNGAWGGSSGGNMQLQQYPAYAGQSGSNPATYPAQGISTPITPSGAGNWITDYNSIGYMPSDPIMGGSYSAPSSVNFSTTQGTNPATQVGIAYPSQQSIYDTFSNVTGAGINYMGGSPSFNEATGQYTNVTRSPIANPTTLPTTLSEYDLFGTAGASSGLFLDTPTIKQNAVGTTAAVDTETTAAEPAQGGGLGVLTIGLIALKVLSSS
jgi:hypothetical protein